MAEVAGGLVDDRARIGREGTHDRERVDGFSRSSPRDAGAPAHPRAAPSRIVAKGQNVPTAAMP
jgi:hypothetical protein